MNRATGRATSRARWPAPTPRAVLRDRSGGFSLVEVLVALALTGLVLGALAMVTRAWLPNWKRGLNRVEQSELIALAVDRMAADLSVAQFVPVNMKEKAPLFSGTETSVTFVRTALGPNAAPGLEIVELAPTGDGPGAAFARRAAPYAPRPEDADPPRFGARAVLLKAPLRISLSYAGRDGTWRDGWQEAEELPRAVRITVRDGTRPRALDSSTAVVIHAEVPARCVTDASQPLLCGLAPSAAQPKTAEASPSTPDAGNDIDTGGDADTGGDDE